MHFSFKFNTSKHFSRFKTILLLIIYIRAKERLCSDTHKRRCILGFSTKCIENYSQKYSSLFTKQAETPINTGGVGGEEWWCTLHHSSPLFTYAILEEKISERQWIRHQWRPGFVINEDQALSSMKTRPCHL